MIILFLRICTVESPKMYRESPDKITQGSRATNKEHFLDSPLLPLPSTWGSKVPQKQLCELYNYERKAYLIAAFHRGLFSSE